jgi:hypothetical protein
MLACSVVAVAVAANRAVVPLPAASRSAVIRAATVLVCWPGCTAFATAIVAAASQFAASLAVPLRASRAVRLLASQAAVVKPIAAIRAANLAAVAVASLAGYSTVTVDAAAAKQAAVAMPVAELRLAAVAAADR